MKDLAAFSGFTGHSNEIVAHSRQAVRSDLNLDLNTHQVVSNPSKLARNAMFKCKTIEVSAGDSEELKEMSIT